MKTCPKCGVEKPPTDFYRRRRHGKDSLQGWCKTCSLASLAANGREWHSKHPEHARAYYRQHPAIWRRYNLKKKYGLTLEDYAAMLVAQGGVCAICGASRPGGRGAFPVDRDHQSNMVRGLLCNNCNRLVGQYEKAVRSGVPAYLALFTKPEKD